MKPLERDRRDNLRAFKKNVFALFKGRQTFRKHFPKEECRKNLYDAILFEKGIHGGIENKKLIAQFEIALKELDITYNTNILEGLFV